MTFFWPVLVALVGLALAFVWWPWLRPKAEVAVCVADIDRNQLNVDIFKQRVSELEQELVEGNLDQTAFDDLHLELERNLLQEVDDAPRAATADQPFSVWIPLAMTLIIPLLSFYFYLQLGSSDLLNQPRQTAASQHPDTGHDLSGIDAQVAALKARLEAEPGNSQGWFTLGRTYLTLQRYQDAYGAFTKVGELVGEHAEIISQQAQALYYLNNRQITAEVQQIIDRALALDPQDPGTLGLLGMAAYDAGQLSKAIDLWQQLVTSDRTNVNRAGLQQAIAAARSELAQQGIEYRPQSTPSATAQPDSELALASLKVLVELDRALKGTVAPETTVFVYAQAVTGSKMPLAATRLQVRDLPAMVTLDDSMAMGPMVKLSSAEQVQVRATVSFSGSPGAKPGDIQGVMSPVKVAGNDELIKILISEVVN
ncbi:MAG: c-type cytochrome biogenesis protein CcmI [Motiliproteus sp.]